MKKYSRLATPDLSRRLVAAGVLSGETKDSTVVQPAPPELLIVQVGGVTESSAFDLNSGSGTGYCISLHIAIDLPKLKIYGWKLDLPWRDIQFQWLPDASGDVYPGNVYKVPGGGNLEFPRDAVINHRHIVRRGEPLDGLLLGFGYESIPDTYSHGANIDASLVLIDEMWHEFKTPVQLWVNRMAKIDAPRAKKVARRRLVEIREVAAEELVQK